MFLFLSFFIYLIYFYWPSSSHWSKHFKCSGRMKQNLVLAFQAADPLLELRASVCEQVCSGCLRGSLCLQQPSISPRWSAVDFHSQMFWIFFLQALVLQAGESHVGLVSLISLPQQTQFLTATRGCRTSRFGSPLLLSVSMWRLLYFLSSRSSVQLVFRWFSGIYNLAVILTWWWKKASTTFTYSTILAGTSKLSGHSNF